MTMHTLHKANELIAVAELTKSVFILVIEGKGSPHRKALRADSRLEVVAGKFVNVLNVLPFEGTAPRAMEGICQPFALETVFNEGVERAEGIKPEQPYLLFGRKGRENGNWREGFCYCH